MLIVKPANLYKHVPVQQPYGSSQSLFVSRLTNVLNGTVGKLRDAVEAMIWRLAIHPSQSVSRFKYVELSIGYIAKAAGVGRETARQAWHRVRTAAGWFSVPIHQVRDMGVTIRRLPRDGVWGQHLLIDPHASAAALQVARDLKLGPIHTALPDAPGWEPLTPVRRGRHLMACCPWHDDQTPSVILNTNPDGLSGSGVCMSCTDLKGERLRIYWRSHNGLFAARHARSILAHDPVKSSTGTIDNLGSLSGPSVYLLGRLGSGGMSRSGSKCSDLLSLLRHADRRSLTDRAADDAAWEQARGAKIPDMYVSVDLMTAVQWRVINTRRGEVSIPDRWEATKTRWVLADLDDFADAPVGDARLAVAAAGLESWAKKHHGLTGRIGVIRTSHFGVQVVAELSDVIASPNKWSRSATAKALYRDLDRASMAMSRAAGFSGGHADLCVHTSGRMMRRPGWRQDKDGNLCRSRLVYASQPAQLRGC